MPKEIEPLINKTRYLMLGKGWLRNCDIAKIIPCSPGLATRIMKEIKHKIKDNGFVPYEQAISAKAFLQHTGWSMDEIYALAQKEIALTRSEKPNMSYEDILK